MGTIMTGIKRCSMAFLSLLFFCNYINGQESLYKENIRAKAFVVNDNMIKLRWAPTSAGKWIEGNKYGYTIEKQTVMIDGVWQDSPSKQINRDIKLKPLEEWKQILSESEYAAVMAQAFYGEDFELSAAREKSFDVGSIINQANELEQRFATSVFMAEYDYNAADIAGWAWTDSSVKTNEKYLYRISINSPNPMPGDTAAIFIGADDKIELPRPIGLNAISGDKSILLSWNYYLLSPIYHSYHIEKKTKEEDFFTRITELPVTALSSETPEIFHKDSLLVNEAEYQYRIVGLTSFDEESPVSDTIIAKGAEQVHCIPHILKGDFFSADSAHVFFEFNCSGKNLVEKLQLKRSDKPTGEDEIVLDSISVSDTTLSVYLYNEYNYLKLCAINKDGSIHESFPFLVKKTDSIPPAIPLGLKVEIDTMGIAHLSWRMNEEGDLRGYRILRSFTENSEKTSLISEFILDSCYTDTLSLALKNPKVYYSLSALDMRFNESLPCKEVAAIKPTKFLPAEPVFIDIIISEDTIRLSWATDPNRSDVSYTLQRTSLENPEYNKTLFVGSSSENTYTDIISESGFYEYSVTAEDASGRKSHSPQSVKKELVIREKLNRVSGFSSYIDREEKYIELLWRKNERAAFYRIYKAEEGEGMTLWREVDSSTNRIVDESVSLSTRYLYTILFVTEESRPSQPKTITIDF